jgi:outer membrane protein assembly factor BamB
MLLFAAVMSVVLSHTTVARSDSWKAWLGNRADSIWTENEKSLDLEAKPLKLAWKSKLGGGYSGPSIHGDSVAVMDFTPATGEKAPANVFDRGTVRGKEGIQCFDLQTGSLKWSHSYDETYTISYPAGPRTTPIFTENRVIALGAEGRLSVIDRANGKLIWEKDFKEAFQSKTPLWGFAGHPLLFDGSIICLVGGDDGAGVVSFDLITGKENWRALNLNEMGYCPPTLIQRNGQQELIIWSGDGIDSLNPLDGSSLWNIPWKLQSALSIPTPRQYGNLLYFTCFYNGSTLLDLKANPPSLVWQTKKPSEKDTTHLNSIISTPFLHEGHIYGICSYGQLRCLEIESGKRIWETMDATTRDDNKLERWANAFIIKNGSGIRFLLFNESGDLIDCDLTPEGYVEHGRMNLIKPNGKDLRRRPIVWSHPGMTQDYICVRNDDSIACYKLP